MPILTAPSAPTHDLGDTSFTSLATPSRGSRDTAVWRVTVAPGTPAVPHTLTREEVFVVLAGTASVRMDGVSGTAATGDAIVVPAGVAFELGNDSDHPLRMLCCMPVGGQARLADGTMLTPPWSL